MNAYTPKSLGKELVCPLCLMPISHRDFRLGDVEYMADMKPAHAGCYWEALGDEVEENPIVSPSPHAQN